MPGAPHRKTGRTVARPSSSSGSRAGVTVTAACTQGLLGLLFEADPDQCGRGEARAQPIYRAPGPFCRRLRAAITA
ncbi:hypothetical protein GCM10023323_37630 [Streptomyces thinghirensis]|uniref:Uncharacterized protein n=1 Tax=Streptomyces thinghirensis TaxID=551547 RepID=A0ABP9T3Q6_9ACTN